jgi:peptidoglycan/xylan/chitin deacetylase (PgdA/CDA1 family)
MRWSRSVIPAAYYAVKAAKTVGRRLRLASPDSLRVLLYHDIAPAEEAHFASQLRWLAQSWNFLTPERFAAVVGAQEPLRGRNLLLSFDDGFASNRRVAERILQPLGIRALFFVVSDFVALQNREDARQFIARHIQPGVVAATLPDHLYNMGWSDLEALLEQGHCIAAHTRTHARLSLLSGEAELEREIITSADTIAQRLGIPVDHFAYTFGDLASFSPQALAVARRRFRFIYSGLRGDNAPGVSPLALRRDAAGPADSFATLGAYLEGAIDLRYARSRAQLAEWQQAC